MDLESADAVHLIAEEVYSVRQLMGEGIDVDDAASDGKLARFVNVVRLVEAEAEQRLLYKHDIYALPYSKLQRLLLELLSGHDELAESLRIGDDEKR